MIFCTVDKEVDDILHNGQEVDDNNLLSVQGDR